MASRDGDGATAMSREQTSIPDAAEGSQITRAEAIWPGRRGLAALLVLAVVAGGLVGWLWPRTPAMPGDRSPEVGFARDMMRHHAQAVEMALLLRDQGDDPELRQIALDIILTQQAQIGQMQGWLSIWNQPVASLEPAMAWMGMPTSGLMPGMATVDELNQLRDARGLEAEGLFLHLMIPHHRAGVVMARAVLDRTENLAVRRLARSIVAAQENEIAVMQELLRRKGLPPAPDENQEHQQHGGGSVPGPTPRMTHA